MIEYPVLKLGSRGSAVARLQQELNRKIPHGRRLDPDGDFGRRTRSAVIDFQNEYWLEEDGIAGAVTQDALYETEGTRPVLHDVTYLAQPTATTCWAASAAMILNRTVAQIRSATPAALLTADGSLRNDSEDSSPGGTHDRFARIHGLRHERPQSWPTNALHRMLSYGPVMMEVLWDWDTYRRGLGSNGHYVVVAGVRGSLALGGKRLTLRIYDPLPPHIYSVTYANVLRRVPLATYGFFSRLI